MRKNTVLLLSHCFSPNTGGVETHLSDLTAYFRKKSISCLVLTYQPLVTRARGSSVEKNGTVTVVRLPWIAFGLFNRLERFPLLQFLYLFPPLFLAALLVMSFNPNRISVIHCHGMVCAVIGRLLKGFFRKRVIVSTHAIYGWLYDFDKGLLPSFLKWTLSGADRVIALAEYARQELLSIGIPERKTGRYTYWVDQSLFKPSDRIIARKELSLKETFTVLFVGRLIPVKGVLALADAVAELPEIQCVITGDGPLRPTIASKASSCTNIVYAGNIHNRDLPRYYNSADILCVPSQYEEGFGRIILEALSCGCPVMASRKGGIIEAMDESVGYFMDPTADGIRACLKNLLNNRSQLEKKRDAARNYAEMRYSEANAEAIISAYQL